MGKKGGLKKNGSGKNAYAKMLHDRKTLWTCKVMAYSQQEMLDAAALTLYKFYDFTPEQQKEFHDRFEAKYAEIHKMQAEDAEDGEYFREAMETAMKDAFGEYYVPRDVRYNIQIADQDGNVWEM